MAFCMSHLAKVIHRDRGVRGEWEGPSDFQEGARSSVLSCEKDSSCDRGVRGEWEGPSDFQEGAHSPCSYE